MFNTFGAEALLSQGKSGQSPKVLVTDRSDYFSIRGAGWPITSANSQGGERSDGLAGLPNLRPLVRLGNPSAREKTDNEVFCRVALNQRPANTLWPC